MSENYSHIAEPFRHAASLSDSERIELLSDDRWVDYERGRTVLDFIDRCRRTHGRIRPQSLLVYGESGVGKSAIRIKYEEDNKASSERVAGAFIMPVVSFQMPPEPEETDFFLAIVESMGAPAENYTRTRTARDAAISLLRRNRCEVLLIDEIQFALSGTARKQRVFLNNIRWLSNEVQQPIVCFGNEDAPAVFGSDPQIARRFKNVQLENWYADLPGFKLFVRAIQKSLPLRKPSELESNAALNLLLNESEGITSDLIDIIERAAETAIRSGEERITLGILGSVCGYDQKAELLAH